jgi:putative endonuclease
MTAPRADRRARGAQARRSGGRAEWIAALLLMAKGYRILGMRLRTRQGEVDLAARRGRVLAIVEVKQRRTLEEALIAVSPAQRERLRRAGLVLAAREGAKAQPEVRLDLVALAPGRWPRHIADAWPDAGLG